MKNDDATYRRDNGGSASPKKKYPISVLFPLGIAEIVAVRLSLAKIHDLAAERQRVERERVEMCDLEPLNPDLTGIAVGGTALGLTEEIA